MADEYYTIAQAAKKLGKTEDEIKAMSKEGDLIGMNNGSEVVFDKKEIDRLANSDKTAEADDSVFSITDDTLAGGTNVSDQTDMDDFDNTADNEMSSILGLADTMNVDGDTMAGSTVDPLEDLDAELNDGQAEEKTDLDLAGDANLESAESGSGLLDLSIQADDTSFGAVLDDIMPGDDENQVEGIDDFNFDEPGQEEKPAEESGLKLEETPAIEEEQSPDMQKDLTREAVAFSAPAAAGPAETPADVDSTSGAYGAMLLLPVIGVVIAAIVVSAAVSGVTPGIFEMLQKYIWYVVIALAVLSLLLLGISAMMSSSSDKPKKAKTKTKKEKKKKEKKPKKAKK
ncbi:hypothetical protein SMSP2_02843 [Limihaloglobus sulfuriphilus]|uniref:Helix-turn-helix domain-containing protein n=1 Tax=Limihaloglobus sulfuriphilus TaxID=1851148 RepID=A0A1Q2MIV8_9BACT|nr:hypothetical protein [Limihaloglobus sulfuriphilus]AQQ72458.1 hypothetical protein SMSP2_02843 [Limihaloglobus sulfuriphilus]